MSALSSVNWSWCTRRQRPKSTTDALCHQLADQSAISNGNPTKATAVACSNQSADTVRRFRKPLDGIHDRRFQTSNEKHVAPDRPTNPPYPDPLIQPSSIHLDPHDRLAGSQPSTSCVPKKKNDGHLQSVAIERRNFRIDRLVRNSGHVPPPVLTYLDNRCKSDSATHSYRSQSAG